jgi:hypothetical protein
VLRQQHKAGERMFIDWAGGRSRSTTGTAARRGRRLGDGAAQRSERRDCWEIAGHLTPDLYIPVLDYAVEDFKESAQRFFCRADAYVLVGRGGREPSLRNVPVEQSSAGRSSEFLRATTKVSG